jgi:hypothetical protein
LAEHTRQSGTGHFIGADLRPTAGADPEEAPPLAPGASREEIGRRLAAVMGEATSAALGRQEGGLSPDVWASVFMPGPDVTSTVLDEEAVLLNLANGVYYSLNPVGTVVWEQLTGSRPLEEVLEAVCRQFAVTEEAARRDLVALVSRLRDEGLIAERR